MARRPRAPQPYQRSPFHEVEDREARRVPGAARGGEHMARARHVVAHRFRRVATEEDRAGVAHGARQQVGIRHRELEMLGRDSVDDRRRGVQGVDQDDGAVVPPRGGGDGGALEAREVAGDRALDRVGEAGVVRHQDRLRGLVVFRLGQQIGGDPGRVVPGVRHDEDLGGSGDHVYADNRRTGTVWPRSRRRFPDRRSCRPQVWRPSPTPARRSRCAPPIR